MAAAYLITSEAIMTQILEKTKIKSYKLDGRPSILDNGNIIEICAYIEHQDITLDDDYLKVTMHMSKPDYRGELQIDSVSVSYADWNGIEIEHDHLDIDDFIYQVDCEHQMYDDAYEAQAEAYHDEQMG